MKSQIPNPKSQIKIKFPGVASCCGLATALTVYVFLAAAGWAGEAEGERKTVSTRPDEVEMRVRSVLDCMAIGRRLFNQGDYIQAAREFEKVLQLDPLNSSAAEYLAECKKRLGER